MRLFDMHCHMGFAENARELMNEMRTVGAVPANSELADRTPTNSELACAAWPNARRAPVGALCATVEPSEFERMVDLVDGVPQVRVGLGLHPWWVADGRCGQADVSQFEALARTARFIGEVGLDFSPRWEHAREVQLAAFERVVAACVSSCEGPLPGALPNDAQLSGGQGFLAGSSDDADCASRKVISLHAVRAAGKVMDALQRHDAFARHACVFHWFSGTSDELQRAIRLGAYFSLGERMLATRRGAAYARAIPKDRLLLETDYPSEPGFAATCAEWFCQLERALSLLAEARGEDCTQLALCLEENARTLLR